MMIFYIFFMLLVVANAKPKPAFKLPVHENFDGMTKLYCKCTLWSVQQSYILDKYLAYQKKQLKSVGIDYDNLDLWISTNGKRLELEKNYTFNQLGNKMIVYDHQKPIYELTKKNVYDIQKTFGCSIVVDDLPFLYVVLNNCTEFDN